MGLSIRANVNFRLVKVTLPTESVAGRLRTVPYSSAHFFVFYNFYVM